LSNTIAQFDHQVLMLAKLLVDSLDDARLVKELGGALEAGMNVLVTYRMSPAAAERTVAELKALGVAARAFAVDLANAAAVAQLADAALAQAGASLAVVVNNAPVCPGVRPYRSYPPYLVSEAGLIHMTRALALELAPEVQVNCICPGPVLLPEDYDPATAEAVRRSNTARAARDSRRDRSRGADLCRGRICYRRNPHGGRRAIDRLKGSRRPSLDEPNRRVRACTGYVCPT
jgi:NAD(P)-dependent dehydrogenase (short-subunit alcohol dehydrogenase family)